MQMYVNKNGQQLGPFDETKVEQMLRDGQFSPDDLGFVEGQQTWMKLNDLFPPNLPTLPRAWTPGNIETDLPLKGNVRKRSKIAWILIYLASLSLFLFGAIPLFLFVIFGEQLFPRSLLFGYKPPDIVPTYLFLGIFLSLQFLFIYFISSKQMNKLLWNGIGLSPMPEKTNPSVNSRAKKASIQAANRRLAINRWAKYPEYFADYFVTQNLPPPNVKLNALKFYGNLSRFESFLGLGLLIKIFAYVFVLSQGCDAINAAPKLETEELREIDISGDKIRR